MSLIELNQAHLLFLPIPPSCISSVMAYSILVLSRPCFSRLLGVLTKILKHSSANANLFKANNRNNRKNCEINVILLSLLFTVKIFYIFFWCFYFSLGTGNYLLGEEICPYFALVYENMKRTEISIILFMKMFFYCNKRLIWCVSRNNDDFFHDCDCSLRNGSLVNEKVKGAPLMWIWKSANIFVFIWK